MKYKNSDVGNRVIRKIIAGPTWIPPKTEPLSALVQAASSEWGDPEYGQL